MFTEFENALKIHFLVNFTNFVRWVAFIGSNTLQNKCISIGIEWNSWWKWSVKYKSRCNACAVYAGRYRGNKPVSSLISRPVSRSERHQSALHNVKCKKESGRNCWHEYYTGLLCSFLSCGLTMWEHNSRAARRTQARRRNQHNYNKNAFIIGPASYLPINIFVCLITVEFNIISSH